MLHSLFFHFVLQSLAKKKKKERKEVEVELGYGDGHFWIGFFEGKLDDFL